MRQLILALTLSLTLSAQLCHAEDAAPLTLEAAKAKAVETNKPVLIKFYSVTCGACKKMAKTTLKAEKVTKSLEGFIVVKVDIDIEKQLAESYRVQNLPTFVALSPSALIVDRVSEYMEEERFLKHLTEFQRLSTEVETRAKPLREAQSKGGYEQKLAWAKFLIKQGNHSEAIEVLKSQLNNKDLNIDQRQVAGTKALNSELMIKRFETCRKTAEAVIKLRPKSDRAALAHYLVGYSFEAGGEPAKAKLRYQQIVENHANTKYAKLAKARLKVLSK